MNVAIEDFEKCNTFSKRVYLKKVIENVSFNGYVMEFGVWSGDSINKISLLLPNQTVYGFDSFEGLPEDWIKSDTKINKKGTFSINGKLPDVNKNVKLIKGWFDDTLPLWIKDHPEPISFLHIDSDLYSSAKTILTLLNKQIITDTIILFDELKSWSKKNNYPNWKEGEWKALTEWVATYNREFEPILKTKLKQAAIRILK